MCNTYQKKGSIQDFIPKIDATKDWYNAAQMVDYFRKLNPTPAKLNE